MASKMTPEPIADPVPALAGRGVGRGDAVGLDRDDGRADRLDDVDERTTIRSCSRPVRVVDVEAVVVPPASVGRAGRMTGRADREVGSAGGEQGRGEDRAQDEAGADRPAEDARSAGRGRCLRGVGATGSVGAMNVAGVQIGWVGSGRGSPWGVSGVIGSYMRGSFLPPGPLRHMRAPDAGGVGRNR